MDDHVLDRPVWSSLRTRHAPLAIGAGDALRFRRGISTLAGTRDESAESLAALADLVAPGEIVVVGQVPPIACPPGLDVALATTALQMVFQGWRDRPKPAHELVPLTGDDAAAMYELAILTKPGPYAAGSNTLGEFWGVKRDGRLVAMAGERMKQPGYTEVSAVCTHPDFRGRGLARALCARVVEHVLERGETPYLHAYASNAQAARLYESLGFALRRTIHVAQLTRP